VFRSGVTYARGGRIFYFQPGHEEYPTYHDKNVRRVIRNAVHWAAPCNKAHRVIPCENPEPLERG
jgi:trehalose utilization protein